MPPSLLNCLQVFLVASSSWTYFPLHSRRTHHVTKKPPPFNFVLVRMKKFIMTCRDFSLCTPCMIPIYPWNIHHLINFTLCGFNFFNLAQGYIFVFLQSPPDRFGHTNPQWYPSREWSPSRWHHTTLWSLTCWFHIHMSLSIEKYVSHISLILLHIPSQLFTYNFYIRI